MGPSGIERRSARRGSWLRSVGDIIYVPAISLR